MITPINALLAFILVALLGWIIAEGKYKIITFTHSPEEAEGYEEMQEAYEKNGCRELTLRDLLKKSCTTGFQAI